MLLFLAGITVCGQTFTGKTDRFTTQDGLPHNTITSLCQDRTGFLWVGTSNGLCIYDGIDFSLVHLPEGGNNHWSGVVETIFEDRDGLMWFGTRSGEVLSMNEEGAWKTHGNLSDQGDFVNCFYQDSYGKLWLGSSYGKVGHLNREKDDVIWKANLNQSVEHLYLDRSNNLWLGGLYEVKRLESQSFKELKIPSTLSSKINPGSLHEIDTSGRLLYDADNVLLIYDIEHNALKVLKPDSIKSQPSIANGTTLLWKTGVHIATLDPIGLNYNRYQINEDRASYTIGEVMRDQTGLIWVATNTGLIKIDTRRYRFQTNSVEQGNIRLDNNYIRALKSSGNELWVGFKQGPVTRIYFDSLQSRQKLNYKAVKPNGDTLEQITVNSILVQKDGNILCGSFEGLFVFNSDDQVFERYTLETCKDFLHSEIWALAEDHKGRLWIGGKGIGLRLIGSSQRCRQIVLNGNEQDVWKIGQMQNGEIWVGTNNGLYRLKESPQSEFIVSRLEEIPEQSIWDFKEDGKGNYFIASTEKGFSIYNDITRNVTHYTTKEGLPSNSVSGVELDNFGNAWISSTNGLCRLNYKEGKISNFYEQDGLTSNDFNFKVNDQSTNGELFFGTKNGLLRFLPFEEGKPGSPGANIVIRSFQTDGEEMIDELQGDVLQLPHNRNNVNLRFALLDYSGPAKNQYQYKLHPFDEEWKQTDGRSPMANYTNLPPAQYQFFLKASSDGVHWQDHSGEIRFAIRPAIWQRPWFIPVLFGFATTILFLILYLVFRSKLKKEKRKMEVEKKIASLELKALQAQMNPHFIFNAVNSIQHFMLKGDMLAANDYLTRFARLMRFFLEASIEKKVLLKDEIEMLKLYLELEALRFDSAFDFEINCPDLTAMEIPTMLIQPYVENAIHHGLATKKGKGHLKLDIKTKDNKLIIHIDDNGIGRQNARKLKNIFDGDRKSRAMELMAERMEMTNVLDDEQIHAEVIDKTDDLGNALGTRVIITLTSKIEGP